MPRTAYGELKARERSQARRVKPKRGLGAKSRVDKLKCGAKKKKSAGLCTLPAGFRTNHPGSGRCLFHGGSAPNGIKAAAKQELGRIMGEPMEINPVDALYWCIRITAGEIRWLSDQIQSKVTDRNIIEEDNFAQKQLSIWVRARQEAMDRLAKYSNMAISLGLAERQVRLAEQYGNMLAKLIEGILGDLELSPIQREQAPAIVRRNLVAIAAPQIEEAA